MAMIGQIAIAMSVQTQQLKAGLGKSTAMIHKFEATASQAGGALKALFAGAAVYGAAKGLGRHISAGSDLAENMSKVQAVFGSGSKTVERGRTDGGGVRDLEERVPLRHRGPGRPVQGRRGSTPTRPRQDVGRVHQARRRRRQLREHPLRRGLRQAQGRPHRRERAAQEPGRPDQRGPRQGPGDGHGAGQGRRHALGAGQGPGPHGADHGIARRRPGRPGEDGERRGERQPRHLRADREPRGDDRHRPPAGRPVRARGPQRRRVGIALAWQDSGLAALGQARRRPARRRPSRARSGWCRPPSCGSPTPGPS